MPLPLPPSSAAWVDRAPARCPADSGGELRDIDEPHEVLEIRAPKVELAQVVVLPVVPRLQWLEGIPITHPMVHRMEHQCYELVDIV